MAQLIKLQDYITRYEWDTYRYPTQYVRLKRESWDQLYERWANPEENLEEVDHAPADEEKQGIFSRLKNKLMKRNVYSETMKEETIESKEELPATERELRQQFLDSLFQFQMKWATSTVTQQSIVDNKYYRDPLLKYLLQRFPDTYLVMYYPIFEIKQAPIEADIILISPIEIEIIQFVELEDDAVIMAGDERTWQVETPRDKRKMLNPFISLKRTERLIKGILASQDVQFSIKKTVLSRSNPILFATEPYQSRIIGRANYSDWFQEKRSLRSPLKNAQIKVAELLLSKCQSTSIKRPEWVEDTGGSEGREEL